ncbi:MAG: class I SAM-dependent methyltransferase [Pseudomonadota bacterium]
MMDLRLRKHPLGYWEIANKPTPEELQQYYAEKYYQEGKGSYELEYSEDELMYFNAKLGQRFAVLRRYLSPAQEKPCLLDVGCGEGYALAFFRKHGWEVKGLDFSAAGVASKNPDCVDALTTGDVFALLEAEIDAGKTYDVVWLQNVLEHVLDPLGLLKSLRTLVAPGGLAVVTVPNDCSITQRAALAAGHVDNAFWVAPPDHLTYFDGCSLGNAASETGWQCVEMLGDFPVDWFLFHPGSNYVRDRSVGKAAHKARVQIENLIHAQSSEDVIRFWSAAAKLGLGRDITAFLRPGGAI